MTNCKSQNPALHNTDAKYVITHHLNNSHSTRVIYKIIIIKPQADIESTLVKSVQRSSIRTTL